MNLNYLRDDINKFIRQDNLNYEQNKALIDKDILILQKDSDTRNELEHQQLTNRYIRQDGFFKVQNFLKYYNDFKDIS